MQNSGLPRDRIPGNSRRHSFERLRGSLPKPGSWNQVPETGFMAGHGYIIVALSEGRLSGGGASG